MKVIVFGSGSKTAHTLYTLLSEEQLKNFLWCSGKEKPEWFGGEDWITEDFTDEEFITSIIVEHKPTHVINLSAITNVDQCEVDKQEATVVNHIIPEYISLLSTKHSFHFIHISTDYVFDGMKGLYELDDVISENCLNWYGITKQSSEKVVLDNNGCVIRTNVLYGSNLYKNDFISSIKEQLLQKHIPSIVVDQFNNPTHLKDLANVILLVIEKNIQGIVHTGGKDWASRWEVAQILAISLNINPSDGNLLAITSKSLNQKAIRPTYAGLSISKTEELLGYTFSGIYDYVLEQSTIEKLIDKEENPHWTILKNLISVLRSAPNELRKKTQFDFIKHIHGTISVFITNQKIFTEIEIGKNTFSGLLYKKSENENSLELITGDVFTLETMKGFLKQVEEFA